LRQAWELSSLWMENLPGGPTGLHPSGV